MKKNRLFVLLLTLTIVLGVLIPGAQAMAITARDEDGSDGLLPLEGELAGWSADSEALASLMQFVSKSVDENHEGYIPPKDRIAVFDFDGTLYGERFPTSFNLWFNGWRALHCEDYDAPERLKVYAAQKEAQAAVRNGIQDT